MLRRLITSNTLVLRDNLCISMARPSVFLISLSVLVNWDGAFALSATGAVMQVSLSLKEVSLICRFVFIQRGHLSSKHVRESP